MNTRKHCRFVEPDMYVKQWEHTQKIGITVNTFFICLIRAYKQEIIFM